METWIDNFKNIVCDAASRLSTISEEAAAKPIAPGKWSPKEIMGHLIDSASNNHQRFVRAQFTDDLVFDGYDQEHWVTSQNYNLEPWDQLINLWKFYNLHLVHVMDQTPTETRDQIRTDHNLDQIAFRVVDVKSPTSLSYLMRDYIEHLKNHLDQISGIVPA